METVDEAHGRICVAASGAVGGIAVCLRSTHCTPFGLEASLTRQREELRRQFGFAARGTVGRVE